MATKETFKGRGRFAAKTQKTRQADNLRRVSRRTEAYQAQEARKSKAPAPHYQQPKPFNPWRLVIQLGLVAALVAALLMGVSVFFKVKTVVVYGNDKYDAYTIQEAAGIYDGENLLAFGSIRACGRIMDQLPYVKDARIGITLPETVNIYITEYPVVYSVEDTTGNWWLMGSDGKIVDKTDVGAAGGHTQINGLQLSNPVLGEMAVPGEAQTETATNAAGEAIQLPVITTAAERLQAALTVMNALETCDVLGQVVSIDVSKPGDMSLQYGERFEVLLGDSENMEKKIAWMRDAVAQIAAYQNGTLDLTFTTYPDQAGFTPSE